MGTVFPFESSEIHAVEVPAENKRDSHCSTPLRHISRHSFAEELNACTFNPPALLEPASLQATKELATHDPT